MQLLMLHEKKKMSVKICSKWIEKKKKTEQKLNKTGMKKWFLLVDKWMSLACELCYSVKIL